MVCGAPVWWSSGGRSAVQTMSGTRGVVRLDHRGVQLGGRGAARDTDDRRPTRGQRKTEREERRAPLVETHVWCEAGCQRDGQRRRA